MSITRYYRDEERALGNAPLTRCRSQDLEEGQRIITPRGGLTAAIEHVQWEDNHPDGPDTHVAVYFEEGLWLDVIFDIEFTCVWYSETRPFDIDELELRAPSSWATAGGLAEWALNGAQQ